MVRPVPPPRLPSNSHQGFYSQGGGPGGQSINKTENNVQLLHKPSGIRVSCQETRSLQTNRRMARRLLLEKACLAYPRLWAHLTGFNDSWTRFRILVFLQANFKGQNNVRENVKGERKQRRGTEIVERPNRTLFGNTQKQYKVTSASASERYKSDKSALQQTSVMSGLNSLATVIRRFVHLYLTVP